MGQTLPQEVDSCNRASGGTFLAASLDGCPRARVPGGLLSVNGEIALGHLQLGYRPIPLIRSQDRQWVPAVPWKSFQSRAPSQQDIVEWWMRYPDAGVALVCGPHAGLFVLDVDPRHGGQDPQLDAPACSTPRGGAHYHFAAPASVPDLDGPGLEWLGDCHIARVPPTPGYKWLDGGLPPRRASYEAGQVPAATEAPRPFLHDSSHVFVWQPLRSLEPSPG